MNHQYRIESDSPETRPLPEVRSAQSLCLTPPNDDDTLIRNRFLCRGGGLVLAGPSGVGKSTLTAGLCAAFARGESYLGIEPAGQLKILVIQAENDDGDLYEQLKGAIGGVSGEEKAFTERLRYVTVDHLSGKDFLEAVCEYLAAEKPDLLVIDCLSAYLGDSPTETRPLSNFLRDGLTQRLRQFQCGCVLVHHTPKTTNQNREGWTASDMQYAMAGASDLANWMRSGLLIEATNLPDLFRLHVTKRASRMGWKNVEGSPVSVKLIRHSKPQMFGVSPLRWEMADQEDVERLAKAKIKPSKAEKRIPQDEEILAWFPTETDGDNPARWLLTTEELKLKFKENGFSKNDLAALMERLVKEGRVERIVKARNGKCYALPSIAAKYRRLTA